MAFWLRALPEEHVLVSGAYGCTQLAPGQAVPFDGSPQHNTAVDEIRDGRSLLEVIESDTDPSLSSPPTEHEERASAAVEQAAAHAASHERAIAAQLPAPPPPHAAPDGDAPVMPPTPTTTSEETP